MCDNQKRQNQRYYDDQRLQNRDRRISHAKDQQEVRVAVLFGTVFKDMFSNDIFHDKGRILPYSSQSVPIILETKSVQLQRDNYKELERNQRYLLVSSKRGRCIDYAYSKNHSAPPNVHEHLFSHTNRE